jgi:hypothetical protein
MWWLTIVVLGGPIALAWLDVRLISRGWPWMVWVVTIAWLIFWDICYVYVIRDQVYRTHHSLPQLVTDFGYVRLLVPALLAFGLPAFAVAFVAFDRDEESHRSSFRRCAGWGVVMAVVGGPFGMFAAFTLCLGACV